MNTKKIEDKIWSDFTLVFDTSALLDIYKLKFEQRKALYSILNEKQIDLFIPGHVMMEYKKNRESIINKLTKEDIYNPSIIKDENNNKYLKELNCMLEINPHFFSNENFKSQVEDKINDIKKSIESIRDLYKKERKLKHIDHNKLTKEDDVMIFLESKKIGKDYLYQEKLEIIKEGYIRYMNRIPPGYKDSSPNNTSKVGVQQYGDLFIWKQILKYAKESSTNIILISNDVKSDWYQTQDKMPNEPYNDLICEFHDYTKKSIWFYTLSNFVGQMVERYRERPGCICFNEGTLLGIKEALDYIKEEKIRNERKKAIESCDKIRFICDECKQETEIPEIDINFSDWANETIERNDGAIIIAHNCIHNYKCKCGEDYEIIFSVYEYPEGCFYGEEINIDKGEILGCTINVEKYCPMGHEVNY